jgi:hypothetical protein
VKRPSQAGLAPVLASILIFAQGAPAPCRPGEPPPGPESPGTVLARRLLQDPTEADWRRLAEFGGTLTRAEFEGRLREVFDPYGGMERFLRVSDGAVTVLPADRANAEAVIIRFAQPGEARRAAPRPFVTPEEFRGRPGGAGGPLSGLRVAIEPADIGGKWAKLEDRSAFFQGYGTVNEGDLNLQVAAILAGRLKALGATVFAVRTRSEPVTSVLPADLAPIIASVLRERPALLPEAFWIRDREGFRDSGARLRAASELLLTKTIETRARAELVRREFRPDLTVVLQHNATPRSSGGQLAAQNRNVFFVDGAFAPDELREPGERLQLLDKLLGDVTPVELAVAERISERFREATGFPPVLYHDSQSTRILVPGDPYVVARNLAFNRSHDGPVVVTEPYFMNQAETLARLLAGDFDGERVVAGRPRGSIFREYAEAVAQGILDAYGPAGSPPRPKETLRASR